MENEDLELENLIDSLYDKEGFILEIFSGAVLPITHPNYYDNRLSIRLVQSADVNITTAEIEKDTYKVSKEKIETIKKYLSENFDRLIEIALKQGTEMYVGGETSLIIKIKSVHIMIDCNNIIVDDAAFVDSVIEKIVTIIKD